MRPIVVLSLCAFITAGCSGGSPSPQPSAQAPAPAPAPKPPDGRREISAARDAFRKVAQFSLTTTSVTKLGEFTQLTEVDCEVAYFHDKYTKDLSAEGIAADTTLTQGRPKAHQESERLFVDGASYYRNSGGWENPSVGTEDAQPNWTPSLNSWDPTKECEMYRLPNGIPFLPFEKILAQKITYEDTLGDGDDRCHQFKVTYPDFAYSDTMKTSTAPDGSTLSYRPETTKPVESKICIGVADHLPWTIEKEGKTYTLSYEEFSRLRMAKF